MLCAWKGFEISEFGLLLVWMKTKYFSSPCKRPVQHWLSCISGTQLWSRAAKSWGAADWKAKIPVPHGCPAQQPGAGAMSPAAPQMCGRGWGSWEQLRALGREQRCLAEQLPEPDRASKPWPFLISLRIKPHCPGCCFDLCKSALSTQSTSDQR